MSRLQIRRIDSKTCCLTGIHPTLVICLQELPGILELRGKPHADARLFPAPTAHDEAINTDWAETIQPELQHLFATAGETVARDLTQLKPSPRHPDQYFLTFPAAHLPAWMNALNQARLILAALTGLDEIDMNVAYATLDQRKAAAAARVDCLGALLHLLVQRELRGSRKPSRPPA